MLRVITIWVFSLRLKATEDATDAYNKALAIDPDHAKAHNNMGLIFQHKEKFKKALSAHNKALASESEKMHLLAA